MNMEKWDAFIICDDFTKYYTCFFYYSEAPTKLWDSQSSL